ncbi:hypothetical protein [Rarobacter incanus]|uniref:Uncharacterized protein n=1 Tax=Rarobacter incanus TaxID=153494 RepID=A0A542SR75_9MICO|nr:hypothetical protein [Rarobacter incanus]TQK77113.1 hypothetical protein FB389_1828 [Rarobacter incanus]
MDDQQVGAAAPLAPTERTDYAAADSRRLKIILAGEAAMLVAAVLVVFVLKIVTGTGAIAIFAAIVTINALIMTWHVRVITNRGQHQARQAPGGK